MSAAAPAGSKDFLFKVVLIGDLGTGKTSIVERCVKKTFSGRNLATIGVDFAVKMIDWDPTTRIKLQLWDISGRERFVDMTRIYYKEAVGAFLVFDLTSESSVETVIKWKEDLDKKAVLPTGSPVPCILMANKCDLPRQGWVTDDEGVAELGRRCHCLNTFKTSAKKNINIEEALNTLISTMMANHPEIEERVNKDNNIFLAESDTLGAFEARQGCCS